MCQPAKWWIGLLPLLALWLVMNWLETGRVERDVAARADAALTQVTGEHGFSMASGRDVSINGWIFNEAMRPAALAAAAAVPGVRQVADGLSEPPPRNPYVWRAALAEGVLTLSGAVSSPTERAAIVGAAQKALPGTRIADDMSYYSGAPKDFVGKADGALQVVSHLSEGRAELRGDDLDISGQAPNSAEYRAATTEAHRQPEGVKLVRADILAPKAPVFAFQAENDGEQVALSGFVGSESERAALLAQAKKLFPDRNVVDSLQIASGAPAKFAASAGFALRSLAQLKSGKASLLDNVTKLSGQARAGMDAASVAAALAGGQVLALDARGVLPGAMSPYVMGAEKTEKALVLTGYYDDEETHGKILEMAKEKFSGLDVTDRMRRSAGAPQSFVAAALYGLEQLARLLVGNFSLRDRTASLSGDAGAADVADQVRTSFIAAMPDGFSVETQLSGAARETPPAAPAPVATNPPPAPGQIAAKETEAKETEGKQAEAKDCQARLTELVRATPIQFEFASAALKPQSSGVLDALAAAAKLCPTISFEVSGHTDDIGIVSHNMDLSRRRAAAVVDYLVRAGIDARRLTAVGYGERKPLFPNDSDEDRAKNRRIEFNVK